MEDAIYRNILTPLSAAHFRLSERWRLAPFQENPFEDTAEPTRSGDSTPSARDPLPVSSEPGAPFVSQAENQAPNGSPLDSSGGTSQSDPAELFVYPQPGLNAAMEGLSSALENDTPVLQPALESPYIYSDKKDAAPASNQSWNPFHALIDESTKGKAREASIPVADPQENERPFKQTSASYPSCALCSQLFHSTYNPIQTSSIPISSSRAAERLPFGITLQCPQKHAYCLTCITQYLRFHLEDAEFGRNGYFVGCPSCLLAVMWEIGDVDAERILSSDDMIRWRDMKTSETCQTCQCRFRYTPNPWNMSTGSSTSSSTTTRLPFGTTLGCSKSHPYCVDCMKTFLISTILEGEQGKQVLPLRCPDCPQSMWEFTEDEVEKLLGAEDTVRWCDLKLSRICGICHDTFRNSTSPFETFLSNTNSSVSRLPFGVVFPCSEEGHSYCVECMAKYLNSKLDDGEKGVDIFPVKCPECTWEIGDDEVEVLLGRSDKDRWYHQKLLHTTPKYYCPNPECSALVEVEQDPEYPNAECPSCHKMICIPCGVIWHGDLSCDEFQALPPDERSAADRLLFQLAGGSGWVRCWHCSIVVERISGCNHMTCRCGSEFCIVCGSQWQGGCMRHPPCSTLSAAELEQERIRGAQRARPVPVESRPANGIGLQQMTTETLAAAASRQNDQRNTSRRRSFAEVMQRLLASNPQRTPTRLRVEPAHRARRTARARAPSFGDVMRQVFTK